MAAWQILMHSGKVSVGFGLTNIVISGVAEMPVQKDAESKVHVASMWDFQGEDMLKSGETSSASTRRISCDQRSRCRIMVLTETVMAERRASLKLKGPRRASGRAFTTCKSRVEWRHRCIMNTTDLFLELPTA